MVPADLAAALPHTNTWPLEWVTGAYGACHSCSHVTLVTVIEHCLWLTATCRVSWPGHCQMLAADCGVLPALQTCPLTGLSLTSRRLEQDAAMEAQVQRWCQAHKITPEELRLLAPCHHEALEERACTGEGFP